MMQIKRFEARDIQEALKQVKEAMGPEALILSTKRVKKPSLRFGLPHRSFVEVVAAINRPMDPSPEAPAQPPSLSELQIAGEGDGKRRQENTILQRILSMGLSSELVDGLAEEVQILRKEMQGWSLLEACRGLLYWKLIEKVEVMGPLCEGPKIWSFVGPTGVGKTTTLVKLAALFSAKMSKKVTLITIDTYRIGAIEQLKTYAQILRVPFEIALHREELKQIIGKNMHQDLLLIDTAGRSPNQVSQLEELKDFLAVHPQIENHLILSATTKDKDLNLSVQRFRLLPIKSYIFTKIDETEEYAPMLNQLVRFRRPLSYLTSGQRVPEDIELATKGRVANLVLNQIQWN